MRRLVEQAVEALRLRQEVHGFPVVAGGLHPGPLHLPAAQPARHVQQLAAVVPNSLVSCCRPPRRVSLAPGSWPRPAACRCRSRRSARRTAARPRLLPFRSPCREDAVKRSRPPAGAGGKAEIWSAGSKRQFTALKTAPGVRLVPGVGPAMMIRRQRTAAPRILHPCTRIRTTTRTSPPGPATKRQQPQPASGPQLPGFSRHHGVPQGTRGLCSNSTRTRAVQAM